MIRIRWELLYNRRYKVVVVAVIHMVLIFYGIFLTVSDMISEQYPLSLHELTYVIVYYFTHFILIGFLVMGSKNMLPLLYIPWLVVFLAVFITATCFWIESIFKGSVLYIVPSITNTLVLGSGWLGWTIVAKEFLFLLFISKTRYRIWA